MRKSQQLLDYLQRRGLKPGSNDYGLSALSWLNTNDPKGHGTLNDDSVAIDLTDGSKLRLDLTTGTFSEVH
jgi:hypothetical protein